MNARVWLFPVLSEPVALPRMLRIIARMALGATLLVLPAALSGCGLARPPRADLADHPRIITVDRAVPVACLARTDLPVAPGPVGAQLSGEARHDAAILASALLAERAARDRAMALLGACVK